MSTLSLTATPAALINLGGVIRMRWQVVDAAAAVAVLAVCGFAAQEAGRPYWWQWLLVCAVSVPVAVRTRWPLPATLVTLTASAAVLACGVIPPYAAPVLCAAVALTQYSVAVGMPPSRSVPALATGLGGAVALGLLWPAAPLVAVPAVAVPWLVGWSVRHRRRLAERISDERTARAVTEERLRIARDMHDTVAHSLSMIAMKASVARYVAGVRPEESMTALEVIETASREALVEMRRAVGLLRADPDPARPSGSDEDLRALADRAEQAGIQVELDLVAATTPPAGVRLVVYRVVQEALTNVIRHAKATGCTSASRPAQSRSPSGWSTTALPPRHRAAPVTGCAACASASPCTAATCRPGRILPAGSRCPHAFRTARPARTHSRDRPDPRAHRRRPDAVA